MSEQNSTNSSTTQRRHDLIDLHGSDDDINQESSNDLLSSESSAKIGGNDNDNGKDDED